VVAVCYAENPDSEYRVSGMGLSVVLVHGVIIRRSGLSEEVSGIERDCSISMQRLKMRRQ
jgi:hypothetical protein